MADGNKRSGIENVGIIWNGSTMSFAATIKALLFRNALVRRTVFAYRHRYGWHSANLERQDLAQAYLSGNGIEIGALQFPLPVPRNVRVQYVDRMSAKDLRDQYEELREHPLVPVGIVDDGETLRSIHDGSQDFVIACQFLEHCENPIGTIENFLRVVKDSGILFLAVPNKEKTFDRTRPKTPLSHVWSDYEGRPTWSRERHFLEYARGMSTVYSPDKSETEISDDAAALLARGYSIHYHVWDMDGWIEFIQSLRGRFGFRIECILRHSEEIITVLRKTP